MRSSTPSRVRSFRAAIAASIDVVPVTRMAWTAARATIRDPGADAPPENSLPVLIELVKTPKLPTI